MTTGVRISSPSSASLLLSALALDEVDAFLFLFLLFRDFSSASLADLHSVSVAWTPSTPLRTASTFLPHSLTAFVRASAARTKEIWPPVELTNR